MARGERVLQSQVIDHFTLVIDGEDGQPAKRWKLCYDYRAIARIEELTGKDVKRFDAWKKISSGKDFPVIVHCGLARFNPEVQLDEVLRVLNPEAQAILEDEIFELMFPGSREAFERLQRERQKAGDSPSEAQVPNEGAAAR